MTLSQFPPASLTTSFVFLLLYLFHKLWCFTLNSWLFSLQLLHLSKFIDQSPGSTSYPLASGTSGLKNKERPGPRCDCGPGFVWFQAHPNTHRHAASHPTSSHPPAYPAPWPDQPLPSSVALVTYLHPFCVYGLQSVSRQNVSSPLLCPEHILSISKYH